MRGWGKKQETESGRCRVRGSELLREQFVVIIVEILRWCLVCRPSNRQIQKGEDGGQTAGAGDE